MDTTGLNYDLTGLKGTYEVVDETSIKQSFYNSDGELCVEIFFNEDGLWTSAIDYRTTVQRIAPRSTLGTVTIGTSGTTTAKVAWSTEKEPMNKRVVITAKYQFAVGANRFDTGSVKIPFTIKVGGTTYSTSKAVSCMERDTTFTMYTVTVNMECEDDKDENGNARDWYMGGSNGNVSAQSSGWGPVALSKTNTIVTIDGVDLRGSEAQVEVSHNGDGTATITYWSAYATNRFIYRKSSVSTWTELYLTEVPANTKKTVKVTTGTSVDSVDYVFQARRTYNNVYGATVTKRVYGAGGKLTVSLSSQTATSGTFRIVTDYASKNVQYRIGNGAWINTGIALTETGEVNSFTVSNLSKTVHTISFRSQRTVNLTWGSEYQIEIDLTPDMPLPGTLSLIDVTTSSVTVEISGSVTPAGLLRYEFSKGNEWLSGGINTQFTFNDLDENTEYILIGSVVDKLGRRSVSSNKIYAKTLEGKFVMLITTDGEKMVDMYLITRDIEKKLTKQMVNIIN